MVWYSSDPHYAPMLLWRVGVMISKLLVMDKGSSPPVWVDASSRHSASDGGYRVGSYGGGSYTSGSNDYYCKSACSSQCKQKNDLMGETRQHIIRQHSPSRVDLSDLNVDRKWAAI